MAGWRKDVGKITVLGALAFALGGLIGLAFGQEPATETASAPATSPFSLESVIAFLAAAWAIYVKARAAKTQGVLSAVIAGVEALKGEIAKTLPKDIPEAERIQKAKDLTRTAIQAFTEPAGVEDALKAEVKKATQSGVKVPTPDQLGLGALLLVATLSVGPGCVTAEARKTAGALERKLSVLVKVSDPSAEYIENPVKNGFKEEDARAAYERLLAEIHGTSVDLVKALE